MNTILERNNAIASPLLKFTACLTQAAEPTPGSASASVRDDIGRGHPRILVVDDNETNLEIVAAYLRGGGYHVHCVSGGLEAIQSLGDDHFDLILMDIQMPVMDGVTATRRIRALSAPIGDIPIVAMTGNVLPQQVRSYLEAGMNGHVGKPIDRAQLQDNVQRWLPKADDSGESAARRPSDFDGATFREFVAAVGAEKARQIACRFWDRLSEVFQSNFAEAQREAHGLINVAGVLGFAGLVVTCRRVMEIAQTPDAERGRESMQELQGARCIALENFTKRLLPKLRSVSQPPTILRA